MGYFLCNTRHIETQNVYELPDIHPILLQTHALMSWKRQIRSPSPDLFNSEYNIFMKKILEEVARESSYTTHRSHFSICECLYIPFPYSRTQQSLIHNYKSFFFFQMKVSPLLQDRASEGFFFQLFPFSLKLGSF